MKAAVVTQLGHPPVWSTFDDPVIEAGEQLIDVTIAAVKQLDRAIVAGTHYSSPKTLPFIPGTDGVGRLADGTRVYFAANRRPFGGLAEYAPATWTVALPDDLDDALAAGVVNPALGAFLPINWRGRLQPGETVLILGATGTTGALAVKAARLIGAGRIVAAGRRRAVLQELGADAIIDLSETAEMVQEAFKLEVARGLHLVVDYVWGQPAELLLGALTAGDLHASEGADTRFVSVGAMAGPSIALQSAALRGARLTIMGSGTGNFPPIDVLRATVSNILKHAAQGSLPLRMDVRPAADIAAAWETAKDVRLAFSIR